MDCHTFLRYESKCVVKGITIDDVKTRDMDDAIWVELAENGGLRVTVMVADAARAVHAGSPWDELARHRVETRYFAWGSSPMLPRHLAERDLSLWPDKANKVLVVEIALGKDLVPVKVKLYRSLMKSDAKLAYSDIPGILADPGHPQHEVVERARRLAMGLLATALGLSVPEMNTIITAPALASEEKEPAIDTSEYPVVALQEYCQAKGCLLPAYTFKIDGPPHMPTIMCTCKFDSVEKTGQAANKQGAKRVAAKAMVESLWPK